MRLNGYTSVMPLLPAYTSVAAVLAEMGLAHDELPLGNEPTCEVIRRYIFDRSRYVDACLPQYPRFADAEDKPPVPALIEYVTLNLVCYDLHLYRGITREQVAVINKYHAAAMKTLEDLRQGKIILKGNAA